MTPQTGITLPHGAAATAEEQKGKAQAVAAGEQPVHEDSAMDEDDEDDEAEETDEAEEEEVEAADEDGLEEIDTANIMPRRTRGAKIDFAKAAAENPAEDEEDDEEDDDYVAQDDEAQAQTVPAAESSDKMDED